MLSHKLIVLTLAIFIFPNFLFINTTIAQEERESLVNAVFSVEFETATSLKIQVNMNVQELTVFDMSYDSSELKNIATSTNQSDIETLGAIKLTLRNLLKNQIKNSFVNSTVNAAVEKPYYENTYFKDEYKVNLTSAFFGLSKTVNSQELINGVLDMDAIVFYYFNLQAEHGWNNTYTFSLPDNIKYRYTTGTVESEKIKWIVKNREGLNPVSPAEISLQFVDPTTLVQSSENISLEFILDSSNINLLDIRTNVLIKTLDIKNYNILPEFITELDYIPSDGLRLFVKNGLLNLDDIYNNTIQSIRNLCISTIQQSSFNQTLSMDFAWDSETSNNCSNPFNISQMDTNPPLIAEAVDKNIRITICGMSNRAFFGLINSGGTVNITSNDINFGDGLNKIDFSYNIIFQLPKNITLDGNNSYIWNESKELSGKFESDISPKYSNEEIETYVEIDISKMDLDLPSFFTGKTKLTTTAHITEDTYIKVSNFPSEFTISDKIDLPYLNSDAFRLCTEENVFTPENIDAFLTNKKIIFNTRLSNVLKNLAIQGNIDKDVFYESLKWDGDVSDMDELNPIKTSIFSHKIYQIPFNLSFWMPNISISPQIYTLKGIEEKPISYRIIFPKGISVTVVNMGNKTILQGETNDGRSYVELSFLKDEVATEVIGCVLSASPLYLIGLFVPCILSFILVIVLIAVVYIIRKKRGGFRPKKRDSEPTGYEDQEYYVPPPPSSK